MGDAMTSVRSDVGTLFESQSKAIQAKDVDRLMSLYSADIVYFDTVAPLQYVGSAALRERFQGWFDGYDGPIDVESRGLNISTSGDIAVAHWFSRVSGTLKNGRKVGSWVRVTSCCRRSEDAWLITHEHVSFAVELPSGSVAMDLVPE
jgi:ketosteroid isomerase-like protein